MTERSVVVLFDWLATSEETRLEWSCREIYERHLDSTAAQLTLAEARASGWDEDRSIWEFHRANWPLIAKEAANQVGSSNPGWRVRQLTGTTEGREVAAQTLAHVLAARGYDVATIDRVVRRFDEAEDGHEPLLRETWPAGWKAAVVVGAVSALAASLWSRFAPSVLIPAVSWGMGFVGLAFGLTIRSGHAWARWAATAVYTVGGTVLLASAGRGLAEAFQPVLIVAGLLGLACLATAFLLATARKRPTVTARTDPSDQALHVLGWTVLVYIIVTTAAGVGSMYLTPPRW